MKTIKTLLMISVFFTLYACNTNMDDIMPADDVAALEAMNLAYNSAIEYNDSLANYIESTGINNDETCFSFDNMYHQYDSIFNENHMMYSHNNGGDDHDGNSWMMGSGWMSGNNGSGGQMGSGGMMGGTGSQMGNGFNSSFCTANNLDLMDSLMNVHEDYHPGN